MHLVMHTVFAVIQNCKQGLYSLQSLEQWSRLCLEYNFFLCISQGKGKGEDHD